MQIIIPMAGHSQRFHRAGYKGCKALLPISGEMIINQVVKMFDPHDNFYFVINEQQVLENKEIFSLLKKTAKRVSITVIPPHNYGPTYSALQAFGLNENEPVIISYCDFTVYWNYKSFLAHVGQAEAGIAAFRGFHPASLGETYFAYMRTDGDRMIELREKESFTENRIEEPASAGIYYFNSYSSFKYYANILINEHDFTKQEAYVSLLFNIIVSCGKEVIVHDIEKFICFGTPTDYQQYLYWEKYFSRTRDEHESIKFDLNQINLIPMAGEGSRFKKFGYRVPKPLIPVRGKPMVLRAAASLPEANQWIFIIREADKKNYPIKNAIEKSYPEAVILTVKDTTSGQAATCLLAEKFYNTQSSLLIASCDYEHYFNKSELQALISDETIDGLIWTYRMDISMMRNPSAFAYCETAKDGKTVLRVVEKQTISSNPSKDPLVVGTFWFRNSQDFILGAKEMIKNGIKINGEYYVGTSINQLINIGKRFIIFDVNEWISYGDPHELKILEYWQDFFSNEMQRH